METFNEALVECVKALGGSGKVAPKLYPEKTPESAQRTLLDCLNPDRPAHLNPDQTLLILRLARERGIHMGMEYLAGSLSYAAPVPIEPKDEMAELQLQFIESQKAMAEMIGRMERLKGVQHFPGLKAAA